MAKIGLRPTKFDRKKFDLDLSYGARKEDEVLSIVRDKKLEVKSERGKWMDTGNIAIEHESYGKPSGINATESEVWWHNLCRGEEIFASLVFPTDTLRKIIEHTNNIRSVSGGDNNASRMYLLNLQNIFSTTFIKGIE